MDKVLEVQKSVKDNAGDVQDYLRDLDNWTKQMESKDEQLRQAKKKAKSSNDPPKPREDSPPKKQKTDITTKEKEPEKVEKKSEKKTSDVKIKGYDYAAWDKFDVEAACEEVSKDTEEDEDSEEEEVEEERMRVEAVAEKDRGNDAFKAGNWDKAIEKYTRGMQLDPSNCILPANRAMALLKKGLYGAAETDCSLALSIDPTYIKAFQRRASARTGLKRFGEAVTDYDEVLRLEPGNKAAVAERIKLLDMIREGPKEEKYKPPKDFENKLKGALKASDVETLKRDFNTMKEMTTKLKSAEGKIKEKKTIAGEENRVFPIEKPTHLRSQKPLNRISIVDVDNTEDTMKEEVVTIPKNKSVEQQLEVEKMSDTTQEVTKSTGFCKKIEKEISEDLSKVDLVNVVPEVPKSSSNFLADWKKLKTPVNRSKYLRQFQDTDYKTIFKSSVDGSIFGELVAVIHHLVSRGDSPDIVLRQVRGLCRLPRLSAIAMFMSEQDKSRLRAIIAELECITTLEERKTWTSSLYL